MFSKYIIYVPSSNNIELEFITKEVDYLIEGEFKRTFFSLEKAMEKTMELKQMGSAFVLIEESFTGKKRLISAVTNSDTYFLGEKPVEEESSPIVFKTKASNKKAPDIKFNFKGDFKSESFTSLENYYDMKLLQPILKDHIESTLLHFGFNVKDIELLLIGGMYGWYYDLSLDLTVNPFISSTLNIMDVFKEPLCTKNMVDYYDYNKNYRRKKDFYSYFNITSGYSFGELLSVESRERMKNFYSNCIAKDWIHTTKE